MPATLVEILTERAQQQAHRVAYTFVAQDGTQEFHLNYADLDRKARKIAANIQALNLTGERVVLLYPPGLEYIAAFFGCLYAGAVAVPAYPPRSKRNLNRLRSIIADAQARLVLTTEPLLGKLEKLFSDWPELSNVQCLITENIPDSFAEVWRTSPVDGDSLCLLQYTSGSTSTPRGVMVSHNNLLHNEALISRAFHQGPESVIVSWLPLYHDMGLIGGVLQPLYLGARCVLLSPLSFLQRPSLWLEMITRYQATTSGGPNFAYDLCLRRISAEQRAMFDLSSWQVAFNGAEPVRHETLERFAETFASCGFRREAIFPCYGLAEATLLVSGGKKKSSPPVVKALKRRELEKNRVVVGGQADEDRRYLVSCGHPAPEQRVVVVDPESLAECRRGEVGEVWVAGPSVAQGYWNQPDETDKSFRVYLPENGDGPFLRTGDLGFIDEGELFITGRLKDLIIYRGLNYYPHDIELVAEQSHPMLRPGCGAAFTISVEGSEELVIVFEVERRRGVDLSQVLAVIREAVAEDQEVQVSGIVLVPAGSIPKTSSGKIQRSLCRKMFLAGDFTTVAEWRAGTGIGVSASPPRPDNVESIEAWLTTQLAAKLGVETSRIDVAQPIVRYGIDSLMAVELAHLMQSSFGISIPMVSFLQNSSIRELAASAMSQPDDVPLADAALDLPEQPLSSGQQSLWFMQNLAPESTAYNLARAFSVKTKLEKPALRRALEKLIARHAALRTTFHEADGRLVQRIHEWVDVCFHEQDSLSWSEAVLHERLAAEVHRPFNLEQGPLLRVSSFRREDDEILLLVIHHIISDFWSFAIIMKELSALYAAELNGTSAALDPLQAQYTDYVRWQRELASTAQVMRCEDYWQQQLSGELPLLNLPGDKPRPPFKTFAGGSASLAFDSALAARVRALSREHNVTLYMTLLAAFYVLLHRHTGQEDLIVGTLTSGRTRSQFAGTVGYFVNPLPLRLDLSGDPTFVEVIERVRALVLSAFEHQDYPFPQLVSRLQPQRDPARSPIFDIVFVLQKTQLLEDKDLSAFALEQAGAQLELNGLLLEAVPLADCAAQFDVMFMMAESGGELAGRVEYNTDVYGAEEMGRMVGQYERVLRGAVAQPEERVSRLPMLGEAEREQLLVGWNQGGRGRYRGACVNELFAAQAARTPGAVAVRGARGEQVSYGELAAEAGQVAEYLRERGVGPEQLVGVCMERRPRLLAGLLGILEAGAAYVPLDLRYPDERLRWMLADAGVKLILTESRLAGRVAEIGSESESLKVEEICGQSVVAPVGKGERRGGELRAENLAYVLYTSGSTGRPKGVMITHESAAALLGWAHESYGREELAGVLASTSICFDLSIFELFVPLTCGGTVVLAEDVLGLGELSSREQVRLVNTVPSAMVELLRLGAVPASVRVVNLAGEALAGGLVGAVYEQLPGVEAVWNLYGPTEDTTYSTAGKVARGTRKPTIGQVVSGSRLYVVDGQQELVPAGAVGELVIGGAGLARGYWGSPGLTAERFVPDGLSGLAGARLYRTGDLGRYQSNGEVEYLGRQDQQVKLRGFRIELGEIEAALLAHEWVRGAAVVAQAQAEAGGGPRLVAYVELEPVGAAAAATSGTAELQRHLAARLPAFMLPAAMVVLAALPRTPNGKLDRQGLPAVSEWGESRTGAASGPLTPMEELVAGIWRELLGARELGPEDNFFALGGHSLLATQVVSRLRALFAVELPLRLLFEAPTLAALALALQQNLNADQPLPLPPITRAVRPAELPLSFAQQRLWFLDQLDPRRSVYNIPAAVSLSGDLNVEALGQSLNDLVRRHEILRTTFSNVNGKPVQLIAPELHLPLPLRDLRNLTGAEQEAELERLAREEGQVPFDLLRGPLLRAVLYQLADDEHVLQVTTHHIVGDGWSMGVLVRELSLFYRAAKASEPAPLAELPIQYADFAIWQREYLRDEALHYHVDYWKHQLAGATPLLLPTDNPRPPVQKFRGSHETFAVPADLTASLKTLSQREGVTLFMMLLAAFQTLLHRYSEQSDITIGADIANRNRIETEGLIGFFVNMMVLRVDLSDDPTFRELLKRVRGISLDAYGHQDVPLEKLVEELHPERSLSNNPLFQVVFVLQNQPVPTLEQSGLRISPIAVDAAMVQFDLILSITEVGNELRGRLSYDIDLFIPDTVKQLTKRFQVLLESIVTNPQERLSNLRLLSDEETSGCSHTSFPEAMLSRKDFENLVLEIGNAQG